VFDLYTLYYLTLVSAYNGDEPPKDLMIIFFGIVKNVFVNNYTKHRLNGEVIFHRRNVFIFIKFGTETFNLKVSK